MRVGEEVLLLRAMLNEEFWAIGYVVELYQDFDDKNQHGVTVIFENGSYDGFSYREQQMFLKSVGFKEEYAKYEFKNVTQLVDDYRAGYWNFHNDKNNS